MDPQRLLAKLRQFYSKSRHRDLLTFYMESTYKDTDFIKRFNSNLFYHKRRLRKKAPAPKPMDPQREGPNE